MDGWRNMIWKCGNVGMLITFFDNIPVGYWLIGSGIGDGVKGYTRLDTDAARFAILRTLAK